VATNAEQLAELQAELAAIKTALSAARSGVASVSTDGLSLSNWRLGELRDDRTRVEKSIQRLLRGGRGYQIDLSQQGTDESDVIHSTYTEVNV